MKQGTRGVGMGKAKFEYKEGENMEKGKNTTVKKMETKEASRTLGNGSNFRKGGFRIILAFDACVWRKNVFNF
mgnify:CR=1 FL=1